MTFMQNSQRMDQGSGSDRLGLYWIGLVWLEQSHRLGVTIGHRRTIDENWSPFAIIIALALHANQIVITLHLLGSLDGSLLGAALKKSWDLLALFDGISIKMLYKIIKF